MRLDFVITACRRQGGHVEACTHLSTAAANGPSTAKDSAVPIHRRHAHQGRDLTSRTSAQFGKLKQQHSSGLRTDARHAFEQVRLFLPDRGAVNRFIQVVFDLLQLLPQQLEYRLDALPLKWGQMYR